MHLANAIAYHNDALVQDIHGNEVSGQADWEVVQQFQTQIDGTIE